MSIKTVINLTELTKLSRNLGILPGLVNAKELKYLAEQSLQEKDDSSSLPKLQYKEYLKFLQLIS
jgi:hypothetical protein